MHKIRAEWKCDKCGYVVSVGCKKRDFGEAVEDAKELARKLWVEHTAVCGGWLLDAAKEAYAILDHKTGGFVPAYPLEAKKVLRKALRVLEDE